MTPAAVLALVLFVVAAFALERLWRRADATRSAAHEKELADLAEMGEVVPPSLHPVVDPGRCIGSGACVQACPEKKVIGVVHGQMQLVNPLACVGHGACAAACPMDAITLVYGTSTRGVELPRLDPDYQTNREGLYVVGELGGMGLIRNAVKQGAYAAAHVVSGPDDGAPRRGGGDTLDAVVVGAGPAGVSAALALEDAGLRVDLLEREAFGGTVTHYPRAKVVMTGALDFPRYGQVKRRTMSKEQLVAMFADIRDRTGLEVHEGELVEAIEATADGAFLVRSTGGERRAANVVLALGRRGSPRKLGVPGEDLPKVAYRLLEPREFAGKHVLVVGGGNAAVENALALADDGGCASVAISYRRSAFARCRGENRRRIGEAIEAGAVRALMPTNLVRVDADAVTVRHEDTSEETLPNDAVIVQIGGTAPSDLLRSFGIELVTKYGEA